MVMIILGNYKNNYDTATKTAQWALTPKQLNLVSYSFGITTTVNAQNSAAQVYGGNRQVAIMPPFSEVYIAQW